MASAMRDETALKTFKCMSPAWRMTLTPDTCAGIPTIDKMAIDPEEDSFASALSAPTKEPETAEVATTTRVASNSGIGGGTDYYSPSKKWDN
jgi:hypothetical protein